MFSLDFLTWQFLSEMVLLPLGGIALGALLGGEAARRVRAAIASGRFAEHSFLGVLLRSLNKLPQVWGLQFGLNWAIHAAHFPAFVENAAAKLLFAVFVWTVATFFQRALCQIIELRLTTDGSPASTSLLLNLAGAAVYLVGVIIVMDAYGVSITPLLTALGVGGMAIALGLQETMANLFAGLHLLLTKQVRVGDHIRMESGAEGQITDITWRYAKIHTVTNNVIIVPNNKLAASVLTNYDMPAEGGVAVGNVEDVAFSVTVGVSYDSDLDRVEAVTLEVAREVIARLDPGFDIAEGAATAPAVRFHTFGDSSIDFNVNMHTSSFKNQYRIRHEFIKALKKRYDSEGIDIPFPIRTVRMEGTGQDFPQP